ncbi:hypothetical protein C8R47DRAFT_1098321 [Mycena vitilis]|nr:hypothetical protein C8R47DRAFT_1098321 [Mycena vitilis]
MAEVLVPRSFHRRPFPLFFYFISFVLFSHLVAGQTYTNGRTFTDGLAIIDSPSPQNPGHAGSPISIAVDVSGSGAISSGSNLSTSYRSLEIYLVSAQMNMTVSSGGLLTNETGSTVKHLNWPIPACVQPGDYNLTFYESSYFNNQGIFTITPIPIPVSNPSPSGQCTNLNPVQAQPQSSQPLLQSPFLPGSAPGAASASGASSPPGASASASASASDSASRMVTVVNPASVTITLTLSDGILNLPTVTVTANPTPTTVVMLSIATVTETDQGTITTYTQTSTFTTVVTPTQADSNSSGFIPVNAGSHVTSLPPLCFLFGTWLSSVLLYSRMF